MYHYKVTKDELYMQRCFDLAQLGKGNVSPNPMVGAVLVYNDTIISEGYHEYYGGNHAEVNCINHLTEKSLLSKATLYVNLEPCSHFGKTPPCANLIVNSGIKKVVIANTDPNPIVAGNGIAHLRSNGVEVITTVAAAEGKKLNKTFFVNQIYKRPYIILKWAESADNFIAPENASSQYKLTNDNANMLVHQWRSEVDGIAVGKNTVLIDNPSLTTRLVNGKNPIRVIFDRKLSLTKSYNVFNNETKTIIANSIKEEYTNEIQYLQYQNMQELMQKLLINDIGVLLVEGGYTLLNSFIENNLWDEIKIFQTEKILQKGVKAPLPLTLADSITTIGNNKVINYINHQWII